MKTLKSLLLGSGIGAALGILLVMFFSPLSADEWRAHLQAHYERARQAGRQASTERRRELEAELRELRDA